MTTTTRTIKASARASISYVQPESLSASEMNLLYRALVAHDGPSLRPDWSREQRTQLTGALDKLRGQLLSNQHKEERVDEQVSDQCIAGF